VSVGSSGGRVGGGRRLLGVAVSQVSLISVVGAEGGRG
jgi:hypothetical protein